MLGQPQRHHSRKREPCLEFPACLLKSLGAFPLSLVVELVCETQHQRGHAVPVSNAPMLLAERLNLRGQATIDELGAPGERGPEHVVLLAGHALGEPPGAPLHERKEGVLPVVLGSAVVERKGDQLGLVVGALGGSARRVLTP